MNGNEWLAERFQASRGHLRAVAYRILGSLTEADDAVQESWLRVGHADASAVENLEGCFTTVLARVCLNILRSRKSRGEESLEVEGSKPRVRAKGIDPEDEAVLAESVGLALLVVLERLAPAERVAFVLHDVFDVAFEDIAAIVGRSPAAARQLASRARRRVRGTNRGSGVALSEQRETVEAFLAALRTGDMNSLLPHSMKTLYAEPTASRCLWTRRENSMAPGGWQRRCSSTEISLGLHGHQVNGSGGITVAPDGHLRTLISCTVKGHRITKMEVIADPERLRRLNLAVFPD